VARVLQLLPITPTSFPNPSEGAAVGQAVDFDPMVHVRRFAMTDKKVGCVPREAVVGDVIFVLFGCKMPIALRPVELSGERIVAWVVGPCYLPLVMYGQALKDFQEDTSSRRISIILI
jgi:hypothetical protein